MFERALPTRRIVLVEQFCSWSAWRISSVSRARTYASLISYSSVGRPNIIQSMFSA